MLNWERKQHSVLGRWAWRHLAKHRATVSLHEGLSSTPASQPTSCRAAPTSPAVVHTHWYTPMVSTCLHPTHHTWVTGGQVAGPEPHVGAGGAEVPHLLTARPQEPNPVWRLQVRPCPFVTNQIKDQELLLAATSVSVRPTLQAGQTHLTFTQSQTITGSGSQMCRCSAVCMSCVRRHARVCAGLLPPPSWVRRERRT
jgi:hypothetical protein